MPFKTWLLVLGVLYVGCDIPPKDAVPTDPPRMPAVRAAALRERTVKYTLTGSLA